MKSARAVSIILLLAIAVQRPHVLAFETDQYNLPPVPLADIGEEMAEYVEENIRTSIKTLNTEIARKRACLELPKPPGKCGSAANSHKELDYLRSGEAAAREVFKRLGTGIISPRSHSWLSSHKFRGQPARYKTSYGRSIYSLLPTNYMTISPTVKMFGSSFGTDKIAHLFQQGYGYYATRQRELRGGKDDSAATQKAVAQGVFSEKTYFGTLVGGVFSNADLAANYAGMRFYEGLTKTLRIAGVERPPVMRLIGGSWQFNDAARPDLLRPFVSEHLNEALNPSLYLPVLRSFVRRKVKKNSCPQWRSLFPALARIDYDIQNEQLMRWNNEDYGYRKSKKFVTVGNTCF